MTTSPFLRARRRARVRPHHAGQLTVLALIGALAAPVALTASAPTRAAGPVSVNVIVRVDGIAQERVAVPQGSDVADAVHAAGLGSIEEVTVSPSPDTAVTAGSLVRVTLPIRVRVVADGLVHDVRGTDATVAGFLQRSRLELGPLDRVSPEAGVAPRDGMTIVVTRVGETVRTEDVALPFGEERRETDELERGTTRTVQEGAEGLRRDTYRVRTEDGIEASSELVGQEVVQEPQPRIVEVGTRRPPPQQPCCAGSGQRQEGAASWYDHPRGGFIAAHRTLPMGTVVTVTNLASGRSVQVTIADRGPFIAGRVVDLNREAFAAIAPLSSGVIRVAVTW